MTEKKKMNPRKYSVELFQKQPFELSQAKSSIELDIKTKGSTLGHLSIGRGSVIWHGGKKQHSKRIPWGKFAKLLNSIE